MIKYNKRDLEKNVANEERHNTKEHSIDKDKRNNIDLK